MSDQFTPITTSNADAMLSQFTGIVLLHKKLCPHCKVMSTVLEKLQVMQPSIEVLSLDSEDEVELLQKFGVDRVPTLVVFKNGEQKAHKTGVMNPKETLAFFANA